MLLKNDLLRFQMKDDLVECPVCKGEGLDLDGYLCWKCKGLGRVKYGEGTES
jgi:DnaJ-class molecular chaperone